MTGRDTILGRIRAATTDGSRSAEELPKIRFESDETPEERLATFITHARAYKVVVQTCEEAQVSLDTARLLREAECASVLVPAGFPPDWIPSGIAQVHDDGALERTAIAACGGVVTTCACAIAQTGTIVLDHAAGQGDRALTLLPDFHLCVLRATQIAGLVPEAVSRLAGSVRAGRPLTFVSGPSATSDIELNRVEGVHGPRRLAILIVDDR